jgi:hypothetical protein
MQLLRKMGRSKAGEKKILLGLFGLFCILLASYCRSSQPKANRLQNQPWLALERTGCYGSCPQYKLIVYPNGTTFYHGRRFVKNLGVFEKKLSKTAVEEIKRLIAQSPFFTYEDVYDNEGISDLPAVILYCALEGKEKKVTARLNVPPELSKLIAKIEELIGENGYQPSTKSFP